VLQQNALAISITSSVVGRQQMTDTVNKFEMCPAATSGRMFERQNEATTQTIGIF
jgi:hypothetical protein